MRALGLDLSLSQTGWCIVEYIDGKMNIVEFGIIPSKHLDSHEEKLVLIYNTLNGIINKYQPEIFVAEKQFSGWNVQTAVTLSEVHGVVRLLCGQNNKTIVYYPPQSIRSFVIPNFSTKDEQGVKKTRQVYKDEMMKAMFDLFGKETFGENVVDDITDAASACVAFFKKNPDGYNPPVKKTKKKKETEPKEKKTKKKENK